MMKNKMLFTCKLTFAFMYKTIFNIIERVCLFKSHFSYLDMTVGTSNKYMRCSTKPRCWRYDNDLNHRLCEHISADYREESHFYPSLPDMMPDVSVGYSGYIVQSVGSGGSTALARRHSLGMLRITMECRRQR